MKSANTIRPNTATYLIYEHPLSERMRLFMRLESMFCQMRTYSNAQDYYTIQLFLDAMFDVLDFLHRYETRAEILKDLQRIQIAVSRKTLDFSSFDSLDELNESLKSTLESILHININAISALRENELFTSLRQRNFHQSGNCLFEVPAYQYWLSRHVGTNKPFLQDCYLLFVPLIEAISFILKIVRNCTKATQEESEDGMLLRTIDKNRRNQMLRVHVPETISVFPRISGDNHRFAIRFMEQDDPQSRATQYQASVTFSLQVCAL